MTWNYYYYIFFLSTLFPMSQRHVPFAEGDIIYIQCVWGWIKRIEIHSELLNVKEENPCPDMKNQNT